MGIRDYRDDTFFVRPEDREVTVEPSSSSGSEAGDPDLGGGDLGPPPIADKRWFYLLVLFLGSLC